MCRLIPPWRGMLATAALGSCRLPDANDTHSVAVIAQEDIKRQEQALAEQEQDLRERAAQRAAAPKVDPAIKRMWADLYGHK